MDNTIDLWGNVEDSNGITINVLPLIDEQAHLLENKTKGLVKADFSLVKYQTKRKQDALSMIQSMTQALVTVTPLLDDKEEIVEIDERKNLENAGRLYACGEYKFEIYSDKYKFRLFTLFYQSVFPIKIEIAYGILENKLVKKDINSYEQMKNTLSSVFKSNKVRFIIQRMMEESKN